MLRFPVAVLLAGLTGPSLLAQPAPTLDQILDRMGEYLIEYETQLSSVVAEERFEQNVYGRTATGAVLESEVAFIRLPGGAEWLGFREVKKVNWRPVGKTGPSIAEVLTSAAGDMTKAVAIARESARHNLGLPRTINVPTAPLEIIHPRHRQAHQYELLGPEKVRGTQTMIVGFQETGRPTLVREPPGRDLVSSGRIWIEPTSGAVWRVDWRYQAEQRAGNAPRPPRLRVEFERHKELGFLVPTEMRETFHVPRGTGEGRATYRNFRRFGTSARIVPPPP